MQAFGCPPKILFVIPITFLKGSEHYKTLSCAVTSNRKFKSGITHWFLWNAWSYHFIHISLTFVSVDGFQVQDVTNDVILVCNAISSQHVSGLSSDIEGFTARVPLEHRYHLWSRSVNIDQRVKTVSLDRPQWGVILLQFNVILSRQVLNSKLNCMFLIQVQMAFTSCRADLFWQET